MFSPGCHNTVRFPVMAGVQKDGGLWTWRSGVDADVSRDLSLPLPIPTARGLRIHNSEKVSNF